MATQTTHQTTTRSFALAPSLARPLSTSTRPGVRDGFSTTKPVQRLRRKAPGRRTVTYKNREYYRRTGAIWTDLYHTPADRMHLVNYRPDLDAEHQSYVDTKKQEEEQRRRSGLRDQVRFRQRQRRKMQERQQLNALHEAISTQEDVESLERMRPVPRDKFGKPLVAKNRPYYRRTGALWTDLVHACDERVLFTADPRIVEADRRCAAEIRIREQKEMKKYLVEKQRVQERRFEIRCNFRQRMEERVLSEMEVTGKIGRAPATSALQVPMTEEEAAAMEAEMLQEQQAQLQQQQQQQEGFEEPQDTGDEMAEGTLGGSTGDGEDTAAAAAAAAAGDTGGYAGDGDDAAWLGVRSGSMRSGDEEDSSGGAGRVKAMSYDEAQKRQRHGWQPAMGRSSSSGRVGVASASGGGGSRGAEVSVGRIRPKSASASLRRRPGTAPTASATSGRLSELARPKMPATTMTPGNEYVGMDFQGLLMADEVVAPRVIDLLRAKERQQILQERKYYEEQQQGGGGGSGGGGGGGRMAESNGGQLPTEVGPTGAGRSFDASAVAGDSLHAHDGGHYERLPLGPQEGEAGEEAAAMAAGTGSRPASRQRPVSAAAAHTSSKSGAAYSLNAHRGGGLATSKSTGAMETRGSGGNRRRTQSEDAARKRRTGPGRSARNAAWGRSSSGGGTGGMGGTQQARPRSAPIRRRGAPRPLTASELSAAAARRRQKRAAAEEEITGTVRDLEQFEERMARKRAEAEANGASNSDMALLLDRGN